MTLKYLGTKRMCNFLEMKAEDEKNSLILACKYIIYNRSNICYKTDLRSFIEPWK